jgi:hypothetical protein
VINRKSGHLRRLMSPAKDRPKGSGVAAKRLSRGCPDARNFGSPEQGRGIRVIPRNLFDLDPPVLGLLDLVIATEVVEHTQWPPFS